MPPHGNDIPRAGILTTAKKYFDIRKKVQNLGRKITLHFWYKKCLSFINILKVKIAYLLIALFLQFFEHCAVILTLIVHANNESTTSVAKKVIFLKNRRGRR